MKDLINEIDYEGEEDMDWIRYLNQGLFTDLHESPFPGSSWSYVHHDSLFEEEDGLKRSDEHIKKEVIEALYSSEEVDASLIVVDVLNAHVLLSGSVTSEAQKDEASKVAESIEGIWGVVNDLRVIVTS